jgi:hypothetical protein
MNPMNANDAMLTGLTTAHTGSTVTDNAPNAPADASFDLVVEAVAGSALGNSGAPYSLTISAIDLTTVSQPWPPQTLRQAFDPVTGWRLSGAGPDYRCSQAFPIAVPGGPGGPLAGHTLQFVASLISQGAQSVSIIRGDPFVLV